MKEETLESGLTRGRRLTSFVSYIVQIPRNEPTGSAEHVEISTTGSADTKINHRDCAT